MLKAARLPLRKTVQIYTAHVSVRRVHFSASSPGLDSILVNLLKEITSQCFNLLLLFTAEAELFPLLFDHLYLFFCKLPTQNCARFSPGRPSREHFCVLRLSALCDEGHAYFSQFVVCLVFFLWESNFETLTLQVEMVPREAATIELLG